MLSRLGRTLLNHGNNMLMMRPMVGGHSGIQRNYGWTNFDGRKKIDNVLPVGYSIRRSGHHPFVMAVVPEGESWILESWGKFERQLTPGLHFLVPIRDKVSFKHSLKEITFIIHKQQAITKDNVTLDIDGICYCRIVDAVRASYEVENPFFAITNLAQTTMRSEIGKISLDQTFEERQNLNREIVEDISLAADKWGIKVERYEIRDISVPDNIKRAMELEAEAERKKRQKIRISEATRIAAINVAEGERESKRLTSEGELIQQQNIATGVAFALEAEAEARSFAIKTIADALSGEGGSEAVAMSVASDFVQAYGEIAKKGNTIILPSDHNDVSGFVTKALGIFDAIQRGNLERNLGSRDDWDEMRERNFDYGKNLDDEE